MKYKQVKPVSMFANTTMSHIALTLTIEALMSSASQSGSHTCVMCGFVNHCRAAVNTETFLHIGANECNKGREIFISIIGKCYNSYLLKTHNRDRSESPIGCHETVSVLVPSPLCSLHYRTNLIKSVSNTWLIVFGIGLQRDLNGTWTSGAAENMLCSVTH